MRGLTAVPLGWPKRPLALAAHTPPPRSSGLIDGGIYDAACTFADPTVSFSGLALWKRNIALLLPYLVQPRIELLGLRDLGPGGGDPGAPRQLQVGAAFFSGGAARAPWPPAGAPRRRWPTARVPDPPQAEWTLQTTLALPWRPFVDVVGRTVYTLNADANQVRVQGCRGSLARAPSGLTPSGPHLRRLLPPACTATDCAPR